MTTETNRDRFDAWPMAPMSTKSTKRFFLGGAISINNNTPPLLPTKVFRTPSVFLKSDDVKRVEEEEEENFLFFGDEVKGLMYFFGVLVCMYVHCWSYDERANDEYACGFSNYQVDEKLYRRHRTRAVSRSCEIRCSFFKKKDSFWSIKQGKTYSTLIFTL